LLDREAGCQRNKQWDRTYGSGSGASGAYAIHFHPATGATSSALTQRRRIPSQRVGNKTAPNLGLHDIWIIKADALGNMQWDRTFGASREDGFGSIPPTADGAVSSAAPIGQAQRSGPTSGASSIDGSATAVEP